MWGPQTITKLVYNSNNYGLWYANNYSFHGVYKPSYNWVGPQSTTPLDWSMALNGMGTYTPTLHIWVWQVGTRNQTCLGGPEKTKCKMVHWLFWNFFITRPRPVLVCSKYEARLENTKIWNSDSSAVNALGLKASHHKINSVPAAAASPINCCTTSICNSSCDFYWRTPGFSIRLTIGSLAAPIVPKTRYGATFPADIESQYPLAI